MADEMAKPKLFAPPEPTTLYDDDSGILHSVYFRDQLKTKYPHYFSREILEVSAIDIVRVCSRFDDLKFSNVHL